MESIDFSLEEDDEIQRLETTKLELQNQIEEEANGNSILQANLERRKKSLHERRLALEKDVARLQEQLQKERELRASLEAGSRIDQKTKDELQMIRLAEENFSNLKQRLDDIGAEIKHQHEQTAVLLQDRNNKGQNSSQGTMLSNSKDSEMKNELQQVERSSKNEGQQNNKPDSEQNNESTNKNQNPPLDRSRGSSSKFGRISSDSSSMETFIPKPSPSRKSSSKGEGSSSTTSALSKLTTRLNFLKERRNQIATELQSIDKGRGSPIQHVLSPGKGKIPEPIHIAHNPGKNQDPEGSFSENVENHESQSSHISSKWSSTEVDNSESNNKTDNRDDNRKTDNRDDNKKTDNKNGNKKDSGLKSDAAASSKQNQQHLDRIKSEGGKSSSSKNSDKSRRQDGQQSSTSRTLSR